MSLSMLVRPRAPRAGFRQITLNEARLAWRQPSGIIVAVSVPLALLIIFGEIPDFRVSSPSLDGLSAFVVYIPILIVFVIGVLALTYLPGPLVTYREQGILRRLSTTPVPPSWLLAAQLVVQACLMVVAIGIFSAVGIAFFGLTAPRSLAGLVLTIALCMAAMFGIGLAIGAGAPSSGAARGIMIATFYPLMFFSGLYVPMQLLPGVFQGISHFTPLGAAVQAMQASMLQGFPAAQPMLVLAAYALVFGYLAKRSFRWQ